MPLLNVTLPDGIFSAEEKDAMAAALSEVMTRFQRPGAGNEAVWVMIQELEREAYHTNLDFDLPLAPTEIERREQLLRANR
jgi:phenylpyruvate tautomerase PptA (4-oxalocrotonate tautomerase family)